MGETSEILETFFSNAIIEERSCREDVDHFAKECAVTLEKASGIEKRQPLSSRHNGISKILPTLYLCGANAARPDVLVDLGITLIINVAPELPDTPLPEPPPDYLRISILDKGENNIMKHFNEVTRRIETERLNGGTSLVHCVAGVSRSTSICLAYLMRYMKMTLRDAFLYVKATRPQIRPNVGFFRQLIAYETEILGLSTVSMIFIEAIGQEVPDVYAPQYKAMEQFYRKHRKHARRRD
ncbi:dual specificity protein phosphatase 18-like [Lutzomyia longipalpis]|uniref:Putative dual specificity protein phosphatase 18 n=1 Tax=Lutzomyia longipalpis TaxID=7200 RepID=A0A1B0CIK7_LUTLO|nr:dual specificity protein phosphatase 18-like [Lutzomyia longipalpis]